VSAESLGPSYPVAHSGYGSPYAQTHASHGYLGFRNETESQRSSSVSVTSASAIPAPATSAPPLASQKQAAVQGQSQPPAPSSTKRPIPTVWPPAKRRALAEAAVRTLYLNPANRNKELNSPLILALLDKNPSYLELCEQLESRGIQLHRGNFAKALLQSVPDLASSSQSKSTATNGVVSPTSQAMISQPTTTSQEGMQAVAQPNIHAAAIPSNQNAVPSHIISKAAPLSSLTSRPTMIPGGKFASGPPPSQKRKSKVQAPPALPPMGPKEAMARKRDFADIVDLTQSMDEDSDDVSPPAKEPRLDPNIDPQLFVPTMNHTPVPPSSFRPIFPLKSSQAPVSALDQERQKAEVTRRSAVRANIDLVEPINRANARRKSRYNPLTIARDILLASGRHPTEAPLNAHLAKITTRLPQIGFDSDLSTLRWDVIDPGGPQVPPDESTKISANQRTMGPASGSAASELTTTQTQLVQLAQKQRTKREAQQSNLRNVTNVDSDHTSPSNSAVVEVAIDASHTPPKARPIPKDPTKSPAMATSDSTPSLPKKRGRPPGSKNKNSTKNQSRQVVGVEVQVPRRPKEKRTFESPPHLYSSYDCRWQGCNAKLHNLDTLKKHFAKVHPYKDDQKECLWEGCGTQEEVYDKPSNSYRSVHKPFEFSGRESWVNHILSSHIDPIGWSLGEGPSVRANG
jgi:hypothetical protein